MNKEIVEANKILEIKVGSHLYGTTRPDSDEDFSGVFIPPINYYFGLDKVEEVDLGVVSKLPNGRNAPDAIDRKFYEFRKFVTLALENNPNVLSHLFVDEKNIIFINDIGRELLNNKQLFLHKGLKHRFIGYSISQKKKLIVKRDNYKDLESGLYHITNLKNLVTDKNKFVFEIENALISGGVFSDNGNQHLKCGDIFIQKNITIKNAIEQIQNRVGKFGGRKELVDEYGFDVKFAGNLVRLLLEGKELLETGNLIYPLKERELILDIHKGKYSLADIEKMSKDIEDDINSLHETTNLPAKPRYDEVNKFLVNALEQHFNK